MFGATPNTYATAKCCGWAGRLPAELCRFGLFLAQLRYILHNRQQPSMHLQSLELFGFKSFADKTIFNFHEGVTAIVGPNGCGKSNVCDAVRWVLGEQSAKSLRGDEMADVIFNGAESRKPLGFAEVSLNFTECGEELGVDWHEVRVTRRIYRDGNSEYFLNKTGCRLKDIHSLFADTGVGRAAYSIMEQGKIDLILGSRPEDRRSVFEEAAGITKDKTKKRSDRSVTGSSSTATLPWSCGNGSTAAGARSKRRKPNRTNKTRRSNPPMRCWRRRHDCLSKRTKNSST